MEPVEQPIGGYGDGVSLIPWWRRFTQGPCHDRFRQARQRNGRFAERYRRGISHSRQFARRSTPLAPHVGQRKVKKSPRRSPSIRATLFRLPPTRKHNWRARIGRPQPVVYDIAYISAESGRMKAAA
jgi:hypothetical protein